ncbi:MAG: LPXTG cell wall anchor domain-containing protein [Clostridia bacterium]|nr:LPXTG cell wall anchor domain-containing protein [Clostridia bacterium]
MKTKSYPKRALSAFMSVLILLSVFTVVLTVSVQNANARTGDTVVGVKTFNSTLYDYYYDSEIVGSNILQGVAQSYTNEPYHTLNNYASDYYEANGVDTPVYFGNFYKQDVNTVFDYTQLPSELYNFKWTANLANRSNANAVAQGIFANHLVDGIPAQNSSNGSVKVPYFDKEWLTKSVSQQAMVVNFSFNYGNNYMTMPYTDGDSNGENTFRLFEVIEPGTNYYFAERNSDCNVLADNLYSGVNDDQIGINFKFESWEGMPDSMSVNIMTPAGNTISVPMNADAANKSFWVVIDKNDPATSNIYNQLTAKGRDVKMGEVYENLNFPFDVIDNSGVTYYQFSTRSYQHDVNNNTKDENGNPAGVTTGQNNVYFNGSDWATRSTGVRDWNFEELSAIQPEWAYDNDMGDGFFPNNATDPDSSSAGSYNYASKRDLKYGYAVRYDIPFTLSSNGKVLDKDGNEVATTFEFMGDDDLLVYIDGELVLDMGGAHKMAKGKIDFSTGQAIVTTGAVTDIDAREATGDPLNVRLKASLNSEVTSSNGILADFIANNNTYDPTEPHTMTIYFVERGMFNANAYIRFNLPVYTSVGVEKEVDYSALTEEQKETFLDDEFTYNFKLTTINGEDIEGYAQSIWENITNVDLDNVNGDTYTFTLKDGESVEFGNIPANIGYVISEMDAEGYTLSVLYSQNMNDEQSQAVKLNETVAGSVTDGRASVKYKFLNVANEIPTTTAAPTTVVPTTTVAPATTQAPTTAEPTEPPTTTAVPTTAEPTEPPTTTAAPTTAEPTEPPTTTAVPTTAEPTEPPTTTAVPTTAEPTEPPTTTAAPTTAEPTEPPTTTAAPTTAKPTEAPITIEAVETTLLKPDVPKTGDSNALIYFAMIAVLASAACVYIKKRKA